MALASPMTSHSIILIYTNIYPLLNISYIHIYASMHPCIRNPFYFYIHYIFISIQEHEDIKEGIKLIFDFQRTRQNEKKKIKQRLDNVRHDMPACIAALRSIKEATNVAVALNTTVQVSFLNVEGRRILRLTRGF